MPDRLSDLAFQDTVRWHNVSMHACLMSSPTSTKYAARGACGRYDQLISPQGTGVVGTGPIDWQTRAVMLAMQSFIKPFYVQS